jgi:two-component system response regulator YesN
MKIMIVEDEPILRQGLISKIDWERLNVELAGEASDGFEALDVLEKCQPDIVLTDIRMPGMNGLQFISEARNHYPHLKFVIISGYNDFEYARDAIKYNVKDYLLKPINTLKLHDLLSDLCQELREEKKTAEERSNLEQFSQMFKSSDLEAMDYQMTHLISEQGNRLNQLPPILMDWSCYVVGMVKIIYKKRESRFKENEQSLGRFAVLNILQNLMPPHTDMIMFRHAYNPDEIVIILGFNEKNNLISVIDNLSHKLDWISTYLGLGVSIGIGGIKKVFSHLHFSYMEAKKTIRNRLLVGDGKVFCEQTEPLESLSSFSILNDQSQKTFMIMLEERKYEEFIDYSEQMFRTLAESPNTSYSQFEYLYIEIIHLLKKYMAASTENLSGVDLTEPILDLEDMTTWTDITEKVRQQLNRLEQSQQQILERSSDNIVYSVKQYMSNHFGEDLTLQWVADTYFIHPNYFSKRFKKIVGISFNDYLTNIRIERSQFLLMTTSLKIAQIARLVGYGDQNYFCNVFKKSTGLSPSRYRYHIIPPDITEC